MTVRNSPDRSQESIEEARRLLEEAAARGLAKRAAEKARWDEYHEQLAKMPEYKPGSHGRRVSSITTYNR